MILSLTAACRMVHEFTEWGHGDSTDANMGISWDLPHRYLPSDRLAYPGAPFATLWTQHAEDADRAYAIYRKLRDRGQIGSDHRALFGAFGGRPFRVPAIDGTTAYRARWEPCPWPADQRGELARALAHLDGVALVLLCAIVARKRPPLLSVVSYGVNKPAAALRQLAAAGWVTVEPAPPGKGRGNDDRLIRYAGATRELTAWELDRRDWLCELLARYQYAYEATQSSLRQYRESGVVSRVEVIGAAECCAACRRQYPRPVPIAAGVVIPVPGCTNPDGCVCAVAPIVG